MFGHRQRLAAALLLVAIGGGCSSGDASSAPSAASTSAQTATSVASATSGSATPSATPSASTGAANLGGSIAKGGDLCGLLGPGDFAAAGVSGATVPVENFDDSGNYYCVYAGDSGATGGIEFDAFVGDPAGAYQEMVASAGILSADATGALPGADKAGTVLNGPGGMAGIAACKGQFCFDIDVPTSSGARAQLLAMAGLVLQRGSGLTS
jgi:hypothetical protein